MLGNQRRLRHRASTVRQFRLVVLLRAVNLRHGTHGFTSIPKEVILRIFTLWKNPSTPAGIEPTNLISRDEYDNHWTTGVEFFPSATVFFFICLTGLIQYLISVFSSLTSTFLKLCNLYSILMWPRFEQANFSYMTQITLDTWTTANHSILNPTGYKLPSKEASCYWFETRWSHATSYWMLPN